MTYRLLKASLEEFESIISIRFLKEIYTKRMIDKVLT